jgi:catechol 2,3-dioxygenase-like lactoylglutathione lyase family enzyme
MTINLSKLAHIKTVVADAEKAYQILSNIFGAKKLKDDFESSFAKVIYVGLGDFVLQYIEPKTQTGPWSDQLKTKGPGIFSLAFAVENVKNAVKILQEEERISPIISVDDPNGFYKEIPPEFLNQQIQTQYIFDTMGITGFHIELGEKPSDMELAPSKARYVTGSDTLIGDASTMLHFELVTPDAGKSFEFLNRIFGSEKVETDFSGMLDSDFMHIIHVNLSNVVLQYCQPIAKEGSWHELLEKSGAYVHNLNFCVDDIEETIKKYEAENIPYLFKAKLTPESETHFYMLNCIEKLGFHMEHGQMPDEVPEGFLFIDLKKD